MGMKPKIVKKQEWWIVEKVPGGWEWPRAVAWPSARAALKDAAPSEKVYHCVQTTTKTRIDKKGACK